MISFWLGVFLGVACGGLVGYLTGVTGGYRPLPAPQEYDSEWGMH